MKLEMTHDGLYIDDVKVRPEHFEAVLKQAGYEVSNNDENNRCQSMTTIIPGVQKKCTRALGHSEQDHVWVEDRRRLGNNPCTVFWQDGDEQGEVYEGALIGGKGTPYIPKDATYKPEDY